MTSLDIFEKKIWQGFKSIDIDNGWKLKRTRLEDFTQVDGFYVFTFRLTYNGADFSKVRASMPKVYHDMPASKTYMLKLLTDRIQIKDQKTRRHLDMAQKIWYRSQAQSIKKIEKHFEMAQPIFNPIGFVYSSKGDTIWEMLLSIKDIDNLKRFI